MEDMAVIDEKSRIEDELETLSSYFKTGQFRCPFCEGLLDLKNT